uniref:Fe2OG dioxygenase domain-containing protein n=1 Tax=Spongospora subterranea TaxID=70186 RepID=A0A0H5REJ6_9EUKA|eukprot:CRZ12438.1 hypothetical protein [Spongospora subterranea]
MGSDFTAVPIVDIGALVDPDADPSQKQRAASAIDTALRTVGFMYVMGHGIDQGLVDRARLITRQFFHQDSAVKSKISMENQDVSVRGYQRLGDNITQGKPDWHEAIDFYREIPIGHRLRDDGDPMHSDNQWPETPAQFKPTFDLYIEKMLQLGAFIMEGVARACKLPPDYFVRYYDESYWVMRTIYYPAKESVAKLSNPLDYGCGEHTDYGCLTMINCDDVQGALVAKNRDNQWIIADPVPGAFIVNVGDMLSKWTNGVYRSTPHKVNSVPGSDRVSIPFFFEPNYDALITPLPHFGGSPGDDDGVVFGEHLSKRVLSNFKYSPNVESDNLVRGL